MIDKGLNYAYPLRFKEGGAVAKTPKKPAQFQVINPKNIKSITRAGLAPKGYEFVSRVETPDGGSAKAFRKIGDETGFTIYQREITSGPNSGEQGYYFDDIGDKVGSAGTGGYLKADDAFNQGRTRSSNYVHAANDLIERGVELSDSFVQTLNAALQHHDKYLGGNEAFASRRENIVNAMEDVLGYEKYTGGQYVVDNQGLKAAEPVVAPPPVQPVAPPPEVMPIAPGGDFGLPPPVQPVAPPPVQPVVPPPVEPVVPPPIQPGYGGIFPDQPFVTPPVTGADGTSRTYSPFDGFAGGSMAPTYTAPTPFQYSPGPVQQTLTSEQLLNPSISSSGYSPPIFSRPSAADTRAAGYDAAIQRFANSPFVRPEGIASLQLGNLNLS